MVSREQKNIARSLVHTAAHRRQKEWKKGNKIIILSHNVMNSHSWCC